MKKKILIILITTLCIGGIILTFTKVKADSGWDSSYDSGGGWSSGGGGSDWGSSWDHDYGSYHSSSYSSSSGSTIEGWVMLIILVIIIIYSFCHKMPNRNNDTLSRSIYSDVPDDMLVKFGINKEAFKQMAYNKYVDIQNAWMNFDYTKLQNNLTDELYNSYLMQLEILKSKRQQNIMSDYEKVDVKIINITEENNLINVKTYLRVCMYDYVVDEKNKVVRGTKRQKIDIEYIIDWVREKDTGTIEKCPHCGAEVEAITSGVCKYCRAKVVLPAKDYVMSRKMGIGQRRK